MTAVESLHRDTDYRLLRTLEDPMANAHWCFMHAHRFPRDTGYRACFSVALMKEMREFLKRTSDRLTLRSSNADASLTHVVITSDANLRSQTTSSISNADVRAS